VALPVAVAAAVGLSAVALSDVPARWLVVEDAFVDADAAVVMAGDPDYERTATAAALVRSGRVRLLVLTGGEPGPGDSASSLRAKAIALGVDPSAIRWEAESRSTRGSVVALLPVLAREDVDSVVLVTSPYHQRRASLAARRAWPGIRVSSRPASPSSWSPRSWWKDARSRRVVLGEYLKLAYYTVRGWT
jgi:uncharacterized SAM-binding protein YcdF (DUF218 family)